jgi:hypothetical protein
MEHVQPWHLLLLVVLFGLLIIAWLWNRRRIARWIQTWKAVRKERRIRRLTARAAFLSADDDYDLVYLYQKGFVDPRATGQSITHINGAVESLIRKRIRVVVRPGTFFRSSGAHQNMVTRTTHRFWLNPCFTVQIQVPASCINAECPIPGERDRFRGVAKVKKDLIRFLEAAENEEPMVVQAGVWAITDRYTKADVQRKLFVRDQFGRTWAAVSNHQVARAKRILDKLRIRNYLDGKPWWRFWK